MVSLGLGGLRKGTIGNVKECTLEAGCRASLRRTWGESPLRLFKAFTHHTYSTIIHPYPCCFFIASSFSESYSSLVSPPYPSWQDFCMFVFETVFCCITQACLKFGILPPRIKSAEITVSASMPDSARPFPYQGSSRSSIYSMTTLLCRSPSSGVCAAPQRAVSLLSSLPVGCLQCVWHSKGQRLYFFVSATISLSPNMFTPSSPVKWVASLCPCALCNINSGKLFWHPLCSLELHPLRLSSDTSCYALSTATFRNPEISLAQRSPGT